MNIDRILSRFRIQTKVLIFILPFIISISAVGLTGLYASGLLQGRMEISNGVLQSLSGFRDVTAAMNRFLDDTTPESRDEVTKRLSEQRDMLGRMLAQIGAEEEGRADLEAAETLIASIIGHMDDLWNLHEVEMRLEQNLQKGLSVLSSAQMKVAEATAQVQRKMNNDQSEAKTKLREADRVTLSAGALSSLASEYSRTKDPKAKFELMKSRLEELKKHQTILASAIPASNKAVLDSLATAIKEISAVVATDEPSDEHVSKIQSKLNSFRQLNVYLGLAASQKMKEATQKFAELDEPLVRAEQLLNDTRKVINSGYQIQILLSKFMLAPTEENHSKVTRELRNLRYDMTALEGSASDLPVLAELKKTLLPAVNSMETDVRELVNVAEKRKTDFAAAAAEIDTIWNHLTQFAELQRESAGKERQDANSISIGAMVLGIVIAAFAAIGLVMTFKGPIGQITAAMRRLAEGALDTNISGENRVDEIGEMARALGVFKQNALSKIEIERQSEAERKRAEEERRRNDEEKLNIDRQIDFAVDALAAGLGRLSRGDISETIETPFYGRLEQLRNDFNSSLLRLQQTMTHIRDNTQMIQRNAAEMSASADELSKRTEQQAASLEETAAAVEEITVTVKSSAERAEEANQIVAETKRSADASSAVVANAIDAMARIENASSQIVQIIDVIDDIAFQTNLLALNAGIEAARAGEAGKGFAVVAQEVRELAQRSAHAAQEIKDLIEKSSSEVSSGARLVQQTGEVLTEISQKIVTVSERVEMIARASRDQSNALAEVNSSVNAMDHVTQKNAAMVEETNAATRQLAHEADTLMALVEQFKIGKEDASELVRAA